MAGICETDFFFFLNYTLILPELESCDTSLISLKGDKSLKIQLPYKYSF